MAVTPKILKDIEKDQRDIQNRRDSLNHDRPVEHGFGEGSRLGQGKWRFIHGQWHKIEDAPPVEITQSDAVNMVSNATGCTRAQVDDFNRTFGHMGVKYLPNGKAVYKDTQSRKRVLRARGLFDRDGNESPRNF